MAIANITGNILTDSGIATSSLLPLSGGTLTGPLSGTSATFSSNLIVGSTPILYGNVAIKSNSATSYFGLNVIANGNNNFIALNHTGSVGIIETEFSTGGSHTPIALVTGGGERMRITSGGSVGIGTSSPDSGMVLTLRENSTLGGALALINRNNNRRYDLIVDVNAVDDGFFGIYDRTAGAYRQVITSGGNVGIGTSSPTQLLEVSSSSLPRIVITNTTNSANSGLYFNTKNSSGTVQSGGIYYIPGTTPYLALSGDNSGTHLNITSAGNVGIGTTPSAWGSIFSGGVFQVKNSSLLAYNNNTYLSTNAYFTNSGDNYIGNGFASRYIQTSGQHIWESASNNTSGADAALTLVERMRITSGGNVGIGTSSPSYTLDITGGGRYLKNNEALRLQSVDSLGNYISFLFGTSAFAYIGSNYHLASGSPSANDLGIRGENNVIFLSGGSTERMRITSSGKVNINNTSNTNYQLYVDGGSSSAFAAYSTSPNNQFKLAGTAPGLTINNTITSPTIGGALGACTSANDFITGTAAGDMILINQFTGNKLYITNYSGGVYLTQGATSWTANSDIRIKNINSNITNAVEKLSTLQTINFCYKDDISKKENLGLIAQEVEMVFPELIETNNDGILGVRYTELIPVLIEAIKEQQEQIKELKLELDKIKNK